MKKLRVGKEKGVDALFVGGCNFEMAATHHPPLNPKDWYESNL